MANLNACPCAGATLDRLIQPAILSLLSEGPMHGYGLAERLRELAATGEAKPDISGVYRFLRAMQRKGLVRSSWDLSHNGPPRRLYTITRDGHRCLARWVTTLQRYRDGIDELLRTARNAITRQPAIARRSPNQKRNRGSATFSRGN